MTKQLTCLSSHLARYTATALAVVCLSTIFVPTVLAQPDAAAEPGAEARRDNMLELGAHGSLLFRQLRYEDDIYGFLRGYGLKAAPVFGGYAVIYPFARSADGDLLGRFGVELRYGQMRSFESSRADGARFPTRSHEFIAGLRFRVLGQSLRLRGFDVSAGLGFAQHTFRVRSSVALPNQDNRSAVPSVRYRAIRVDVDGRVPLDAGFFIRGHLGLRIVASAGDIDGDAWFPRARRAGVEAGAHVGYVLPRNIELLAGFETRRYFYNVRPEPGDPFIVGGILDRHVMADFRLAWRY